MSSQFTTDEKRRWRLKKHLRNHLFEYVLDLILPVVFVVLILYICKAEYILRGAVLTFFLRLCSVISDIVHYKKEYIDLDLAKDTENSENNE